jgi:hypothetical protein
MLIRWLGWEKRKLCASPIKRRVANALRGNELITSFSELAEATIRASTVNLIPLPEFGTASQHIGPPAVIASHFGIDSRVTIVYVSAVEDRHRTEGEWFHEQ